MDNTQFIKTAKKLARLGPRGVFGQALLEVALSNTSVIAISADLGNSSGLDRFKATIPSQFLNLGILEQHSVGFAAGLSTQGFNCFLSSFAPFLTMRAGEQVRLNLGYMQSNVKIVGIGSGISMGYLGNSHFGLEDISIIRSIPNIPIISPADCYQVQESINFLSTYNGPAYLRLTGVAPCPTVYDRKYEISLDDSDTLIEGEYILVLSYGSILSEAKKAIDEYSKKAKSKIHLENVYNLHKLPIKTIKLLESFTKIIVVEEHRLTGGLYSMVSEYVGQRKLDCEVRSHCLPNNFLTSGNYNELKEYYKLDKTAIYKTLEEFMK